MLVNSVGVMDGGNPLSEIVQLVLAIMHVCGKSHTWICQLVKVGGRGVPSTLALIMFIT